MRNWNEIEPDVVFVGKDENGVRYLPEFLTDYEQTFKDSANASCRKCLINYYNKITKHLNKMSKKGTSNYRLKAKFNGIQAAFGSTKIISNDNLTDEIAKDLIKNHPHGEKLFDVIPKEQPEDKAKDLNDMSRAELNEKAVSLGLDASDYKNKGEVKEAIIQAGKAA